VAVGHHCAQSERAALFLATTAGQVMLRQLSDCMEQRPRTISSRLHLRPTYFLPPRQVPRGIYLRTTCLPSISQYRVPVASLITPYHLHSWLCKCICSHRVSVYLSVRPSVRLSQVRLVLKCLNVGRR